MPEIARFYGILIKMFFIEGEYLPPHIHALYGEKENRRLRNDYLRNGDRIACRVCRFGSYACYDGRRSLGNVN